MEEILYIQVKQDQSLVYWRLEHCLKDFFFFGRGFFKGILSVGQISRVLEAFPGLLSLPAVAPDGNALINSHVPE